MRSALIVYLRQSACQRRFRTLALQESERIAHSAQPVHAHKLALAIKSRLFMRLDLRFRIFISVTLLFAPLGEFATAQTTSTSTAIAAPAVISEAAANQPTPPDDGQWLVPGKSYGGTRYSALNQINRD